MNLPPLSKGDALTFKQRKFLPEETSQVKCGSFDHRPSLGVDLEFTTALTLGSGRFVGIYTDISARLTKLLDYR